MHNKEKTGARQRELRFEDEGIWTRLPEAVQERCRALCKDLLASILKEDERRPDERKD
jgi:hypothetical protein